MPKKTFNIDEYLDERVRDYIDKYKMTYTSVLTVALHKYFDSIDLTDKLRIAFADTLKDVKKH